MTSAGKLLFGTCILAASFFTAKYLHQSPATNPIGPEPKPTAAKLNWQVHPRSEPASSGLREVATAVEAKGEVRFARLTSATEAVAPPLPAESRPVSTNLVGADPNPRSIAARTPLPFAIAASPRPESQLLAVDDEEVGNNPDAKEFVQHTVQFGETLPQIAMQYTGRRESYMTIYQANLDVLSSPAEITPGIVLKIPLR